MVWQAAGRYTAAWFLLLVFQGAVPVASVFLTREIVDNSVLILNGEGSAILQRTILLVVLLGGLLFSRIGLSGAVEYLGLVQSELVLDHIKNLIHEKIVQLNISLFESRQYFTILDRARTDSLTQPVSLVQNIGGLVRNGITLVGLIAVLFSYSAWIPLLLAASVVPALWVSVRIAQLEDAWKERNTIHYRKIGYFDRLLTTRLPAAEIRLFGLGDFLRHAYQAARTIVREERFEIRRKKIRLQVLPGASALLTTGLVMGWMFWKMTQGLATLGDLTILYQSLSQGQSTARGLLQNISGGYQNMLYMRSLFEFLSLESSTLEESPEQVKPIEITGQIRFENVTFRYPDAEKDVLTDFNMEIPTGVVAAVVGANGAGKSTIMKLLCRFYDPQAGCIRIGGQDIRRFSLLSYWEKLSVFFQFPLFFSGTVFTNIQMGDLPAPESLERVQDAARTAIADDFIAKYPQGYETLLGKAFGGEELSGGQWRRIAQARAYYRDASLFILDEPTESLDPWSESTWQQRLRELASGKTVLIITHRFTTARQADVIYVMDQGKIIESGTHEELVELDGRYAQSWRDQMYSQHKDVQDG